MGKNSRRSSSRHSSKRKASRSPSPNRRRLSKEQFDAARRTYDNMVQDLDKFKAMFADTHTSAGQEIPWALLSFPSFEELVLSPDGKFLFSILHYNPLALYEYLSGLHSAEERDDDGQLESGTFAFLEAVLSAILFGGSMKGDWFPVTFPYQGKLSQVLSPEDEKNIMTAWIAMLKDWITNTEKYPSVTFFFASEGVLKHVQTEIFDSKEALDAFHRANPGRIHSLSSETVITSRHPEWHTNPLFGPAGDAFDFKTYCGILDELCTSIRQTFLGQEAPPCKIGQQFVDKTYSPEVQRLIDIQARNNVLQWLIANNKMDFSVLMSDDKLVPPAVKAYLRKNWAELREYLREKKGIVLDDMNDVLVTWLHSE